MTDVESPGLDLSHGFVQYIRQRQFSHAHQLNTIPPSITKTIKSKRPPQAFYQVPAMRSQSQSSSVSDDASSYIGSRRGSPQKGAPMVSDAVFGDSDLTWEKVELHKFEVEAQHTIYTAIQEPQKLMSRVLAEVGPFFCNRAAEDPDYCGTAAKLCILIAKKEDKSEEDMEIPSYYFRNGMCESMQTLMRSWGEIRSADVEYWLSYCRFSTLVFRGIQPKGFRIKALTDLLYGILDQLIKPPCILNAAEVELLVSILKQCGDSLCQENKTKMDCLINQVRDVFLEPNIDFDLRASLLPVIELHAAKWRC